MTGCGRSGLWGQLADDGDALSGVQRDLAIGVAQGARPDVGVAVDAAEGAPKAHGDGLRLAAGEGGVETARETNSSRRNVAASSRHVTQARAVEKSMARRQLRKGPAGVASRRMSQWGW